MALNRTKSKTPGNLTFGDGDSQHCTSGNVGIDGRVKVQIHQNAQSIVNYFKKHQKPAPEEPLKKRKFSTVALSEHRPATSPRLNIAIHIVGSRGDVQPFIPIAQLLSRPPFGHRVRICTHPVFKNFVEEQGIEFFSIGGDPSELMAYMVRNPGLLPSRESMKAGDVGKRRKEMWDIINGAWRSCIEAGDGTGKPIRAADVPDTKDLFLADAIIANPPSMAHIHCAEKLGIPLHMVFTMPWSPTAKFSHPLAAMKYDGDTDTGTANYFSFILMELLTWQGLGDLINKFRTQTLRLDPVSPLWGYQLLPRLQVPYSYLWSQTLIPKPADWGPHISITGFSFLHLASSYTPPADLAEFLEKGPAPIYVGFGSIVIDDPQGLTDLIYEAVRRAGVRAIVSKGWGGIGNGDKPEDIYLMDNVPHDWLFQRVSAVVHHGGAGTTAAGIAAGRPTVVVPFFGDQPFWGQMIARAGAGPTPIPFKDMTAESLQASIKFALRPEVQIAVQEMADQIAMEDGATDTVTSFQDRHDFSDMRCDLCPDKLAFWKHKGTGAHLSNFAVGCLINEGLIESHDIKFLRHRHWYVDEGAEHPIVGVIAATSLFFTNIATASSEYHRRLKNKHTPPQQPNQVPLEKPSETKNDADQATLTGNRYVEEPNDDGQQPKNIPDGDQLTLTQSIDPAQVPAQRMPTQQQQHVTPEQMEDFAQKLASKSLRGGESVTNQLERQPTFHERRKTHWKAQEAGRHGKAFYYTRATGRFASDVTKAGIKAPISLFYNIANGFHNYPSYRVSAEVRRRDEITGLGSGLRTAGKEFGYGFYDAFTGVVTKPYKGAKEKGIKGFGKGLMEGTLGFTYNIGAAIFGLPGYTLKGFEKEFHKHHLTKLRAEIYLIRIRQGIEEFRAATTAEKDAVVERWKSVCSEKTRR
ncbi:Ff.00g134080.m01.CDS01 [Fusarium sp. VM40]|nr:Ff.00g134080.m01.CDS01 [Fusarium sp. VM40]